MKEIISIILCAAGCATSLFAQPALAEYEHAEKMRIMKCQAIEKAIEIYTEKNINSYLIDGLTKASLKNAARTEGIHAQEHISAILLNEKRSHFREKYFEEYPGLLLFYKAITPPVSLRQTCVNGDFESTTTPTQNWTFNTTKLPKNEPTACTTPSVAVPANPTTNNFSAEVSVMSSANSNYVEFDPNLNTPGRNNIKIPTVSPTGGNQSIKLNGNSGQSDVTTMTRMLTLTDPTIEYEFSLLLQASGHDPTEVPYFRVDVIVEDVVVFTKCILAQPNCIFKVSHDINHTDADQDIYYSNWRCEKINVEDYVGQIATLRFTIGDCDHAGHFGTVYIDNICNYTCDNPAFGVVAIDQPDNDCSNINGTYEVCGSFVPPVNSILTGAVISISKNGGNFQPVTGTSPQITGNNFCFQINPAVFGIIADGDIYQFQVSVLYNQTCSTTTYSSSNVGFTTIKFDNCYCAPVLTLISPGDDVSNNDPLQQRETINWIKAHNTITTGNNDVGDGVVYTAGKFVELNEGFETQLNAQFAAYPKPCNGTFSYRTRRAGSTNGEVPRDVNMAKLAIAKLAGIYPNPADNSVNITTMSVKFKRISIVSAEGKKMLEQNFAGTHTFSADISAYTRGVYIVTVMTDDGRLFAEKLIKN